MALEQTAPSKPSCRWLCALLSLLAAALCSLTGGAQAKLPGCSAVAGVASAQQLCGELSALSAAAAAMRRGEPSVAKQALFGPSLAAGRSQLVPELCLLSPTGDTAAIDRRGKWDSSSLMLARKSAKAGQWLKSSPKDTLPVPGRSGYGQEAFSASGRWLASVHTFTPESGRQAAVAQLYDCVSGRWLPEQLLREGDNTVTYTPVSFTTCQSMAAGTLPSIGMDCEPAYAPAVSGTTQPFVRILPALTRTHAWAWTPGCTSMLLYSSGWLAHCDLDIHACPQQMMACSTWTGFRRAASRSTTPTCA